MKIYFPYQSTHQDKIDDIWGQPIYVKTYISNTKSFYILVSIGLTIYLLTSALGTRTIALKRCLMYCHKNIYLAFGKKKKKHCQNTEPASFNTMKFCN